MVELRHGNPSADEVRTTPLLKSAINVVQLQLMTGEQKEFPGMTHRTFVLFM